MSGLSTRTEIIVISEKDRDVDLVRCVGRKAAVVNYAFRLAAQGIDKIGDLDGKRVSELRSVERTTKQNLLNMLNYLKLNGFIELRPSA